MFHLPPKFAFMRELFILIAHLLVTLAKLGRPGGLGAVAVESLPVKRAQRRAPNLTHEGNRRDPKRR
jgi:hypothetical protein